jgi:shikimate kinase
MAAMMHPPPRHLVYLTGFMGSGKSTIGPILANSLGYEYCDLDRLIENSAGMTIAEIFETNGEDGFRVMERNLLLAVSGRTNTVVALGGGTISHGDNLSIVKSSGILVYLKMSSEEATHRLRNKSDRPLLRTPEGTAPTPEQLRQRVESLLSTREATYALADITVTTDKQVGKTVDEVIHELKPFLR